MKLREVKHGAEKFNLYSNRFILFDKLGRRINEWQVAEIPNYLDLDVIKTVGSGFNSLIYFVGFPTTHIMLDILDDELVCDTLKFGEVETEGR